MKNCVNARFAKAEQNITLSITETIPSDAVIVWQIAASMPILKEQHSFGTPDPPKRF